MELAKFFDHTLLKPDITALDVLQLCREAREFGFAAVCVPPYYVPQAVQATDSSAVKVATVIGFPFGYSATAAKVEEIKRAIDEGAQEMDAVINVCALKNGHWNFVHNDIDRMTTAAHLRGKIIKVIVETGLLNQEELLQVCNICNKLEVDFVKTSTGFSGPGATTEVIRQLREYLDPNVKIKASGGIRTAFDADQLIQAGAHRLGSSGCVAIMRQLQTP